MIELHGVTKRFGRTAVLRDVSLRIGAGEAVALWGPNGAGKTTLIRCVLGLVPFDGRITVAGLPVRRRGKAVRRRIGYVPQEPALFDDLRVWEAVALFARLKRAELSQARALLGDAGMAEHARKRVRELSGGVKQRLTLALALLNDPPVLILDEPTSNLDAAGRRALLGHIGRLREAGKTVLFISHRPEEVRDIADRIITLESGRIVRDEPGRIDATREPILVDGAHAPAALATLAAAGIPARLDCCSQPHANNGAAAHPVHGGAQ
ncbi:MAG: ABC transporter ATP-binding protein [Phycisphaerales bacterium JB039]